MLFKNSVRTSKRTPHFTITKINWLTLFKFKQKITPKLKCMRCEAPRSEDNSVRADSYMSRSIYFCALGESNRCPPVTVLAGPDRGFIIHFPVALFLKICSYKPFRYKSEARVYTSFYFHCCHPLYRCFLLQNGEL
jgi:hypothetical protein